jgi:DNA repair exonuclease SbcCD ATPase subunit
MINLSDAQEDFKALSVESKLLSKDLRSLEISNGIANRKYNDYLKAQKFYLFIAKEMQKEAKEHIENIVTIAIQTVYEYPYTFKLLYEDKRGAVSCTPLVVDGDNEFQPKDAMGGGMLDVIGFALRITLWSMQNPRSDNIFFMDEPFRFAGKLSARVGLMLRRLAKKLNFQVLLVTHDDSLIDICDKVWAIRHKRYSRISLIKGYIEKAKRKIKRRKK